ncbi:hypothetical protein PFISCL1PPCAC_22999, partial [Pristionchus fissidentatus]
RRRNSMYRLTWRVPFASIKLIEGSKGGGARGDRGNKKRTITYALIGNTKAEFLSLVQVRKIRFNEEDMRFLGNLKKISHDNLAAFIGLAFNDTKTFYIMTALVERASLEDFINDADFRMDETFKSAFMRDICRGVTYLHKSAVGYHGMLNLQTCLIDSNWVRTL